MMTENHRVIQGESTVATVMTDEYDENCGEQIQEMVDHPAFENDVAIMPDTHYGSGAVIGFTMPIGDRVVPNTVGVDIGCGMFAVNLGKPLYLTNGDDEAFEELDEEIRKAVPMGRNVHSDPGYHIGNDFPWGECEKTLESFTEAYGYDLEFEGYGLDYFKNICRQLVPDELKGEQAEREANEIMSRAIDSMGTLGGGNHFIEISQSAKTGDYWAVVHSGSRGIGYKIADYWQNEAIKNTTTRKGIEDVPEQYRPYLKDNWKPDSEKIRSEFSGTEIGSMFDKISQLIAEHGPNTDDRNTDLDWLEGEEAVGYFIDMIFAQKYASESRKLMAHTVADVLEVEPLDSIESIHNYVDFDDGVIRKGATRAHADERLVIPFNMRDGTIVCRGKGTAEWNYSAPHGAGRRMSRTQAFSELSFDEFKGEMSDIFSTSVTEDTLDEAPMAYKDTAVVESVIDETAEIIDRWEPVHNIKAEE